MNNLKNILVIVLVLSSTVFYGQRKENHEKIKSLKVAFFTEKLDLSSDEAQSFWPVYNDYQKERETLRKEKRTQIKGKIKNANELSDKEAKDLLEKYLRFEEQEEELDKAFLNTISTIISPKKTLLLLRTEEEFKRQLIRQYRNKRGGSDGGRR